MNVKSQLETIREILEQIKIREISDAQIKILLQNLRSEYLKELENRR